MNDKTHRHNLEDMGLSGKRRAGMTVPEGYFDSFAERMMAQLPADEPQVVELPRRSLWSTVRPYVYMAAMFAGIWLMMNMFSWFGPVKAPMQSPASPQSLLAELVATPQSEGYVADYVSDISDYALYDDLYNSGFDIPDNL
ncbi:MAG: hypothetical protein K2K59_00720 [Muribaculaceae bacterium]|nr:hypothetical protein [Muribaculaceae bacterium]